MRMTKTELETAKSLLANRVAFHNYGLMPHNEKPISMRDHMAFSEAGWDINRDMTVITHEGIPTYRIVRKWAARGHKELQPKLVYIGGDE